MTAKPVPYNFRIEPNADAEFPAESGRYHLYVSLSCPFACRALAARNLLGLEDVVDLSVVHPVKEKRTIVSDDSAGILRTLDSGFRDLVPSDVHLYPEALQEKIDAANDGIVAEVSMALIMKLVSKSADDVASATAQAFAAVAKLDDILPQQRYLVGDSVTEADVRMFHSLIRLDVSQLQTDEKHLTSFTNVAEYLRDLYQIPGLKSTVNWDHLKIGVESKKPGAVAEGPFVDYAAAHERNLLA